MKQFLSKPLNLVIVGIVVLIVILGIVFGVKNMNDQASLKKANEIADTYVSNITNYKKTANEELKTQSTTVTSEETAKAFASNVDKKLKGIPSLETSGKYGADHSDAYKKALGLKNDLTSAYTNLKQSSSDIAAGYSFVGSVQTLLNMKVSDYLGGGAVMDGTPIREKLIPPYQAALDAFKKVQVPKGQEELAKNTTKTYTDFIAAASDAAAKLDAHQSFSFDFSSELASLQDQVATYQTTLQTNFATAVQAATK